MRVFITGATGFIGRALVPVLRREGHQLIAWVRSPKHARSLLGLEATLMATNTGVAALREALERCDAVVNLAGASILGGRWTEARRRTLVESRVQLTERLVRTIAEASPRPRILISGSAVGYYGDRGNEVLDEASTGSTDFLARLCRDWEAAAQVAENFGVRVMILRTGVVLGRDGGALGQMLPPFLLGMGGPPGSGRQYMPWIHLRDFAQLIATALLDSRYRGAINGAAPDQVTSGEFAKSLGRVLDRPAAVAAPAFVLRIVFGKAAAVLLGSQRIDPQRLRDLEFPFEFPKLDQALADIFKKGDVEITPLKYSGEPDTAAGGIYLQKRRPTYELRMRIVLDSPIDEAFRFFSQAENLGLMTPAAMRFELQDKPSAIAQGTTIDYRLRVAHIPIHWRTRIVVWDPQHRFVDLQESGPYRCWWHEHTFHQEAGRTVMDDHVRYAPPFGALGRVANRLFIAPMLRNVFQYRREVIHLRFRASAVEKRSIE